VTADEVYGQDPQLRAELACRGLGRALAVAKSHPVATRRRSGWRNDCPPGPGSGSRPGPAPRAPLVRLALIEAADPAVTRAPDRTGRRRISDGEYAFYRARAPHPVLLAQLEKVASHYR
jgi:hypothetical protein